MEQQRLSPAIPPATLEGWYVSHQVLTLDRAQIEALEGAAADRLGSELAEHLERWAEPGGGGWSAAFQLVGGGGDLMLVHFRDSLERLADALQEQKRSWLGRLARTEYEFLSVTEAGLYHATARAAAEHPNLGAGYERAIADAAAAEAASAHVQTRLYPTVPEGMRYVSFYPMTKRRDGDDNWYRLPVEERSRLMRDHGLTGRRYAGRVFQVISGSIGFADWEWGVTLFARDPLEFKRIVTEMRYDEASSRYGEFGRFFTGLRLEPAEADRLTGRG